QCGYGDPQSAQSLLDAFVVVGAEERLAAARVQKIGDVPLAEQAAVVDDDEAVGEGLHLAEQVGGGKYGVAARGGIAQEGAHPLHRLRVEAIDRHVEDDLARCSAEGG